MDWMATKTRPLINNYYRLIVDKINFTIFARTFVYERMKNNDKDLEWQEFTII